MGWCDWIWQTLQCFDQLQIDMFSLWFHTILFTVLCLFTSGGRSQKVWLWHKFQTYFWWHFGPFKASGRPLSSRVVFCIFSCKLAWNQLTSDGQIPFWRGAPCRAGIRALPVRLMTLDWGPLWPLWLPAAALTPRPLVSHTPLSSSKWIGCFCLAKKKILLMCVRVAQKSLIFENVQRLIK